MDTDERRFIASWAVLPQLAVANGAIRDKTYGKRLPHDLAHSIAVFPLCVLIVAWARLVARWTPLDAAAARSVGCAWLALTVAFEFGFGLARGVPLRELVAAYDVRKGRLWVLAPLVTAAAPVLASQRERSRLHEEEVG